MLYKYINKENNEDFAAGRVIYNKPGVTNYPVRLICEIFMRCLEYSDKKDDIVLYDPCCGAGYNLTVLGMMFLEKIKKIYASDINKEFIDLTKKNLSLLTEEGLRNRKNQIKTMIRNYQKKSHLDALESINNMIYKLDRNISSEVYLVDILSENALDNYNFTADIMIIDVPYGQIVNWSKKNGNEINILLSSIKHVISNKTIVAISYTKKQKYKNVYYKRVEKFKFGHRKIDILRPI
jgi:23S rRNA G2445 N2-methylase RlmL